MNIQTTAVVCAQVPCEQSCRSQQARADVEPEYMGHLYPMSNRTEVRITPDDIEIQHFRLEQSTAANQALGPPTQVARNELHVEQQLSCAHI